MIRYWDGQAWTHHVQPMPTAAPAAAQPSNVTVDVGVAAQQLVGMQRQLQALQQEIERFELRRASLEAELIDTDEVHQLQEVGIYRFVHPLHTSVAYRERISAIGEAIARSVSEGTAIAGTTKWAVNGSAKDGAKMVADFQRLMLRTYNNEAENVVRTMKPHGLSAGVKRLEKVRATIQRLGAIMKVEITDAYHRLRIEELELTADYAQKLSDERDAEREARAKLREEEAARRELQREQERLEKERNHYISVVQRLEQRGDDPAAVAQALAKVEEVQQAISGVVARAANTRAGYVYVISNVGAMGERVVKIGMTRRLEPMDRVRELGDASVPFRFDVHALFFSDDAVGIETSLHRRFAARRVNLVNLHREFFYVPVDEVRVALLELRGDLLSFEPEPAAHEWRQSESLRAGGASALEEEATVGSACLSGGDVFDDEDGALAGM